MSVFSPALSGYRGLRDPEAAKAVGFAAHAGSNTCNFGDTCKGQSDPISNLTKAMSDGLLQVEFHDPTAKSKPLAAFIQEVNHKWDRVGAVKLFRYSLHCLHPNCWMKRTQLPCRCSAACCMRVRCRS